VFVTHDQAEALGLFRSDRGDAGGRIEQLGAPREIYERPATRFVADFIGASTMLRGRAVTGELVAIVGGRQPSRGCGTRAEGRRGGGARDPARARAVATAAGDNVLEAEIAALVYQGAQTELTAKLPVGQRVRVFVTEPAPMPLAPGQRVRLHLPADGFMVIG
jgi:ABC-type Fe3+/spermidine/putrescine transport system ATPase subunit